MFSEYMYIMLFSAYKFMFSVAKFTECFKGKVIYVSQVFPFGRDWVGSASALVGFLNGRFRSPKNE